MSLPPDFPRAPGMASTIEACALVDMLKAPDAGGKNPKGLLNMLALAFAFVLHDHPDDLPAKREQLLTALPAAVAQMIPIAAQYRAQEAADAAATASPT